MRRNNSTGRKIEIFGKTYRLPAISDPEIETLGNQLARKFSEISSPQPEKTGILGFFSPRRKSIGPDDVYRSTAELVRGYDDLVRLLGSRRNEFSRFLDCLEGDIARKISAKASELRRLEAERQALGASIEKTGDSRAAALVDSEGIRLLNLAADLGRASAIMASKLTLCRECLAAMDEDDREQRKALDEVIEGIRRYMKLYSLSRRIDRLEREVRELNDFAEGLEGCLTGFLDPISSLVDRMARVDFGMMEAVEGIRTATQAVLGENPEVLLGIMDSDGDSVLDFLTAAGVREWRIRDMLVEVSGGGTLLPLEGDSPMDRPDKASFEGFLDHALAALGCPAPFASAPIQPRGPAEADKRRQAKDKGTGSAAPDECGQPGKEWPGAGLKIPPWMTLVRIDPGTFDMGSREFESYGTEKPVHPVTLSRCFGISAFPLTNSAAAPLLNAALGKQISVPGHPDSMVRLNRSGLPLMDLEAGSDIMFIDGLFRVRPGRGDHPVTGITWYGAALICNLASESAGLAVLYDTATWFPGPGAGFRLPTEAEWEFCARGGTGDMGFRYPGGEKPEHLAWYCDNSLESTHPVGRKSPNELGLYDMAGNVWEWCLDFFGPYGAGHQSDPCGPESGDQRVMRGGSYNRPPSWLLCHTRGACPPDEGYGDIGLRIVLQL